MNILVMVHDMVVPNRGGGAPRTEAAAKALRDAGHNVFVMAPFGVPAAEATKALGGCRAIPTHHVDRNDRRKFQKHALYLPVLTAKTIIYGKKHRIDMIFVHDSVYGASAMLAAKVLGIPFVLDATDLVSEYIKERKEGGMLRKLLSTGELMVIRSAEKVITVSEEMKSVLKRMGARRVEVVYDGVDFSAFHKCPPKYRKKGKITFIHQGGMDPQDGLSILVPAAERVIKEVPNAMFWLVGAGSVVPELKRAAAARGIEDHFMFSGWVPFREVTRYISDADVGLVILPDILSARIRVTLKTFEYWACGKPIIAAKLPALEEVIDRESGLFYRPDDAQDLAKKMIRMAKDKRLREDIASSGERAVRKFEWKNLGRQIAEKCEGVVKKR
jgi:glycosyltransferase involved in cell wall biosynthesis